MAWKSALIAGAALALSAMLRSRAAADRALVLRLGGLLLVSLPVVAIAFPALNLALLPALDPVPAISGEAPPPDILFASLAPLSAPAPTIWDDPTPLIALLYLGGLAMIGARLIGGLVTLRRWTAEATQVDCPDWLAAFDRVRWAAPQPERVRLLLSESVPSPMSWGWWRPVILIDPDTMREPAHAEAILAHEVAHVARFDWPALMLVRLAAALFWFNPLVWRLERETVQQAEEAADAEVVARVAPTDYAETLVSWARVNQAMVPANSIAPKGSALGRRVRAVLDARLRNRQAGSGWTAAALLACLGLAAPVAAMQVTRAEAPPVPPVPPIAPAPYSAPVAPLAPPPPEASCPPGDHAHRAASIVVRARARAEAARALAAMPDVDAIVASATSAVDHEAITRQVNAALAAAEPAIRAGRDRALIAAREAMRAHRMRPMAFAIPVPPTPPIPPVNVARIRRSIAAGADGMARGADRMEAGAQRMEAQAAQMRDPAYRARAIARARARGETVTDEDLIEAADEMAEGAQDLRESAREMRESARHMRNGDTG